MRAFVLALLGACGGGQPPPGTADAPPPVADTPVDASQELHFYDSNGNVITSLTLPDVHVGEALSGTIQFDQVGWAAGASSTYPEFSVYVISLGTVEFRFTPSDTMARHIKVTAWSSARGSPVIYTGELHVFVNVLP